MKHELPERTFRPTLHRFRVLAGLLPEPRPGDSWLELGGGAGEFALIAAARGYDVTLVDNDPRNIANTASRGIRGMLADLNGPLSDIATESVDGVSLIEVVEHVPGAEGLMAEAFRVLRTDGTLLLSTPNAIWWPERLRSLAGKPSAAEGYHYRFFNVGGVRALCESAGFRVQSVRFSTPAFGVNWVRRRVLGKSKRMHVAVPRPLAGLFAQTVYVMARKP